jgi:hypothetical protein
VGAILAHGKEIIEQSEQLKDGSFFTELIPLGGGYDFPLYSSVQGMIDYAQSKGVSPEVWPVFYGIDLSSSNVEEIRNRCDSLRQQLAELSPEEMEENSWLKRIHGYLVSGKMFWITE